MSNAQVKKFLMEKGTNNVKLNKQCQTNNQ